MIDGTALHGNAACSGPFVREKISAAEMAFAVDQQFDLTLAPHSIERFEYPIAKGQVTWTAHDKADRIYVVHTVATGISRISASASS